MTITNEHSPVLTRKEDGRNGEVEVRLPAISTSVELVNPVRDHLDKEVEAEFRHRDSKGESTKLLRRLHGDIDDTLDHVIREGTRPENLVVGEEETLVIWRDQLQTLVRLGKSRVRNLSNLLREVTEDKELVGGGSSPRPPLLIDVTREVKEERDWTSRFVDLYSYGVKRIKEVEVKFL